MAAEEAKFIGIAALQEIATQYAPEIAMGGAYYRPDVFDRMRIKVISGLQFRSIKHVMNRKGHTTERKVVGKPVNNSVGYLEEREMVCHLAWNHYTDNKDNYIEKAIVAVDGSATFSYPLSEVAFNAVMTNYGEDLFDCLWHGDDSIADDKTLPNWYLRLYTGFIPYLNEDIALGRVSKERGNLVSIGTIDRPADPTDAGAYDEFCKFRDQWSQNLKNAPEVMVYCSDITGANIAKGYANSNANQDRVIRLKDADGKLTGNYMFPEWNNIIVAPESSFGIGEKLIATTPENFEYGVDSLDSRTKISVREGSDNDHDDISFQVQSVQGTRVLNVNPSHFCMTDAPLAPVKGAGDYTKDTYSVVSSDSAFGTVTVNGAAPDNTKGYAPNTTLELVATATAEGEFVRWSNGQTAATITVVTKGQPEGVVAIFKAK